MTANGRSGEGNDGTKFRQFFILGCGGVVAGKSLILGILNAWKLHFQQQIRNMFIDNYILLL